VELIEKEEWGVKKNTMKRLVKDGEKRYLNEKISGRKGEKPGGRGDGK